MSRKIATTSRPTSAARLRLLQRVLAERRRDVRALDLLERDRQRAGLEHEREVLRLADDADARRSGAAAGDAVGEVLSV